MLNLSSLVLPEFYRPETREDAYSVAESLTGKNWQSFSSPRPSPKSTGGAVGGQHFLSLRVKGPEWHISQSLCWLCGQNELTASELIIVLGRKPVTRADGRLEEQISGHIRSNPSQELVEKVHSFALELYPVAKYEKKRRFYDQRLPEDSSKPCIYVIEDIRNDVKIGISTKLKTRFRTIESFEETIIKRFFFTNPTPQAYTVEQEILHIYGVGKHRSKKSREWLWNISFEEACAAVQNAVS